MKDRFMKKVVKTNTCWNWSGAIRGKNGYGAFRLEGKTLSSHRVSFLIFKGKIPKGILVCHTCDNRKCVNPEHLFLGTHKDNMVDAFNKNRIIVPVGSRFKSGEKHLLHILTSDDVENIRKEYGTSKISLRALGKKYNVDHSLIWQVVRGKVCI